MLLGGLQYCLGAASGVIVGFSLGLVGGGGSILAVPLIVYVVGVSDPHRAVGTSALAVAANAIAGLVSHARGGTVRWRVAGLFAASGIAGAWVGSLGGKALAGPRLLGCFAVLMLLVGVMILRGRPPEADAGTSAARASTARLAGLGALTGAVSGFFGIGGGLLIVPGLMYAARLPILEAVSSSLVAVAAFGLTTAVNYARAGWIDWPLAAVFVVGGTLGGIAGTRLARHLAGRRRALNRVFALVVFAVALYIIYRSATGGP
ncbi:MAG: sulfite exporter TauE/SafE family protein [Steroidobacteraceae bacterium]